MEPIKVLNILKIIDIGQWSLCPALLSFLKNDCRPAWADNSDNMGEHVFNIEEVQEKYEENCPEGYKADQEAVGQMKEIEKLIHKNKAGYFRLVTGA